MSGISTTGRRSLTLAVVVALVLSLGTGIVTAQSFEGASGTIVVEADETYDSIDGVAGSIIVYGSVTGDVSGVAGYVHVAESGSVDGSVRVAAGTVRIDGTVGDDFDAGGGHVEVSETGRIGGDMDAGAGFIEVDGRVDGDVRAGAETIVVGPNADVGGEFRYDAASFTRDPDATVAGGVVQDSNVGGGAQEAADAFSVPPAVVALYGLLANLLLGALLLALFPLFSSNVAARATSDPVASGGVGIVTLIGVPIGLVLLAVTVVGIPLAVAGALAFVALLWIGSVYGQYAVGTWVLRLANGQNRWIALLIGLVGFAVLGAVPVLGGFLELVALLLGLGALALGFRERYRSRRDQRTRGRQSTLDEISADVRDSSVAGGEGEP